MYDKVRAFVEEHAMLQQSDRVIAGISGGADSVCLLCVLEKLQEIYGLALVAVHINHGLRGEEAAADEAYVKALCERKGIPLEIYHMDVDQLAAEKKLSCEEAGREARRQAFAEVMAKYGGTKIALAHHMNDNAETVLLNLSRGTGLQGMAGIRPVNASYIRPLLCVTREEIEAYLRGNAIAYCTDRTNLEDIYTRNRIRNHVLPYMETQINEKVVEHIHRLSMQMDGLCGYMERQVEQAFARCVQKGQGCELEVAAFLKEDEALRPYLIKRLLCQAAGREKDIEAVHVQAVMQLAGKQVGKRLMLPYQLVAVRGYDTITIGSARQTDPAQKQDFSMPQIQMRVFPCEKMPEAFPQMPYTKWFDYDIIKNDVIIRSRCAGDYITIDDKGNTQTIKKYFVNAKIPKSQREQVLLAADGDHIMWIIGYRQNQAYQVSEHTKNILEITVNGGQEDGRDN